MGKTNVEFMTDLMEYSDSGALMQAFVIEALYYYSKVMLDNPLPEKGFINPEAWTRCATEAIEAINGRY